jgi:hypothetical protein
MQFPMGVPFQDSQKNHEEIISTYRSHLLNAARVSLLESGRQQRYRAEEGISRLSRPFSSLYVLVILPGPLDPVRGLGCSLSKSREAVCEWEEEPLLLLFLAP